MIIRKSKSALWIVLALLSGATQFATADAGIVTSIAASDAMVVNQTSGAFGVASVVNVNDTFLRVGRFTDSTLAPSGSNVSAVFPFLMPDFGAVANPFSSANFNFNLEQDRSGGYGMALFGLETRPTPNVDIQDFHFGSASGSTPETNLHNNILVSSSLAGAYTSNDFASWLNSQYAGGAGANQYVFLGLAGLGNAATFGGATNGAIITSANAEENTPFVMFDSSFPLVAVPEPSTFSLFALGLIPLSRRRRNKNRNQ